MVRGVGGSRVDLGLLIDTRDEFCTSGAYMEHLHARLETLDVMKRLVQAKGWNGSSSATF